MLLSLAFDSVESNPFPAHILEEVRTELRLTLKKHGIGEVLLVGSSVVRAAMLSYTKTTANYWLKHAAQGSRRRAQTLLQKGGLAQQVGSGIGAGLLFALVNFTSLFSS